MTALKNVSLNFEPGKATVLIGPSGCGKSTLLNMFAGLDQPTDGSIVVNAGDTSRGKVGMMFQKSSLQPWRTVVQNVMLPAELLGLDKKSARARAEELLEMVGLRAWVRRYPAELSGGMQQRVALARVLLPDPEIILLDEPFGALDEMTREVLDLEMRRIVETTGTTIVMVTHSIYEAVLVGDTVAVLSAHPGQLAASIDVPIGRDRSIETTEKQAFSETVAQIRHALRGGEEVAA
ncbi:MAG: ABC transporter ATP-binding protein [Nocardioidaceae bacterium]|nr:ABC transporter ATP-binding protein [Nocardioidaceae bacterium]